MILLILSTLFTFLAEQAILMRRPIVLSLSLQLVFPDFQIHDRVGINGRSEIGFLIWDLSEVRGKCYKTFYGSKL
jgi:hypothetical protein